jgi:predicted GIY-YIG superfamily endonuclease
MYDVYLVRSIANPVKSYVGFTSLPVDERLAAHNAGSVP